MRGIAILAVLAALYVGCTTACAIPVRPIAKVETGKDGLQHFIPDPDQEPSAAAAVPFVTQILGALGPWGDIAALAVMVIGGGAAGHHVGHRRGKKAASKQTAKTEQG